MTTRATGSFQVKTTPLNWSDASVDHTLGRFQLDKEFHGDLEAIGQGQMLTAGSAEKGSAGYVAIEKVTGKLHGRAGSFVFQHSGTMDAGALHLSIAVVPGTGTGELTGLAGTFTIQVADGKHSYEFAYTLATIQ